ncbi:MAG: hypothetical protein IPM31_05650 [Anaerolineae bacterium]|nr:hypothetical protein [Anaerolineae bacterium]MBL8105584.1 hypothetical protein [Anaerolineales bacterium]MCC7189229.1 hypothetical protein [Anaerolineales bacterium]
MNQMKLGDFIAQTILEIISGVSQAQELAKKKGAIVNPQHLQWDDDIKGYKTFISDDETDEQPLVTQIDFDILLTIGEDDKSQGGIGIFAASLGLGVKGEVKEYSESVNRIKFQILAKLPQQS